MDTNEQRDASWDACPQGELLRMAKRLDARDRRVQVGRFFRAATASMLLIAVGVLVVGFMGGLTGSDLTGNGLTNNSAGINCAECRENFAAYHESLQLVFQDAGPSKTESLDPAFSQRMADHLAKCRYCRQQFDERFPGILTSEGVPNKRGSSSRAPAAGQLLLVPTPDVGINSTDVLRHALSFAIDFEVVP